MSSLRQRLCQLVGKTLEGEDGSWMVPTLEGSNCAPATPRRVSTLVAKVRDALEAYLSPEEASDFWSETSRDAPDGRLLVSLTAMIQHDSLGEEYFEPFGLDKNGNLSIQGLFGLSSSGQSLEEETEQEGIFDPSRLECRRLVVASRPPRGEVITTGGGEQRGHRVVLVFYGAAERELQINNLVTILGLLEPPSSNEREEAGGSGSLPRIHVVKLMAADRPNPITTQDVPSLHLQALEYLMGVTGDRNAAKKLLHCLISRVSSRASGLLASLLIGYHPLNIRLPPSDFTDTIIDQIVRIFPHASILRLSPATLEGQIFASTMDYATGELVQGALQVPNQSLLLIDERPLQPGKLSERAAKNLEALLDLVNHQSCQFDFGGQMVSIETDVVILSVSHGKTILPVPCRRPPSPPSLML